MNSIKIDISKISDIVSLETIQKNQEMVRICNEMLYEKKGKSCDFLGWLDLPTSIKKEEIDSIIRASRILRKKSEVVVVIGIGGSYLGARAIIECLVNPFRNFEKYDKKKNIPFVIFAGQNLSSTYHYNLLKILDKKNYSLIVISKSGTTLEPAIAFRVLKSHLEKKYGKKGASKRIVVITDAEKGVLKNISVKEKYQTFVIPDNIGGRYSVLTPVGLLPVSVAGFDIRKLIKGAAEMETHLKDSKSVKDNPADMYAVARNLLYQKGKKIEILVNYNPALHFLGEWWKQLFGESEGKEGKGIFPATVDNTTDLHSMGQLIQEGERNIFETVLWVEKSSKEIILRKDRGNPDKLNYLSGKKLTDINRKAMEGTMMAHIEGRVPNILISIPELNEYYLGQLIYFFQKACAVSGYLLGVNPFDQPGVEAYKNYMFQLLEK